MRRPTRDDAVLRLARAGDEGQERLRAQGHRPRPLRPRDDLRRRHPVRRREPRRALHKISEIYDRIAFAAVGKYNEFENLRLAGVRYADLRGYQYDRSDVTSRGLANAYAQTLGTIFTETGKPYEVELVVAEVGPTAEDDQIYRLTYDGSVAEEHGLRRHGRPGRAHRGRTRDRAPRRRCRSTEAVHLAVGRSRRPGPTASREPSSPTLEAAVLDRTRPRRAFKRLAGPSSSACSAPRRPASADTATDPRTRHPPTDRAPLGDS